MKTHFDKKKLFVDFKKNFQKNRYLDFFLFYSNFVNLWVKNDAPKADSTVEFFNFRIPTLLMSTNSLFVEHLCVCS